MLRTALSLSLVTGKGFAMSNIRGARPKPGLMRQHLACVTAARAVGGATVQGAEIGSQHLVFQPGPVQAGDFHFAIGSGGSTTLVLQTVLPALLHAPAPSRVKVEGGTHNPLAPPFEFVDQCFLPVLRQMGAKATLTLERPGFMQSGGGIIQSEISPVKKWRSLVLHDRGELLELRGTVRNAHLDRRIAAREIQTAVEVLGWAADQFTVVECPESIGPGNMILASARFEHVTEISSAAAQTGRSSEQVGGAAAKGLLKYLENTAPVGVHLADQLLLPLALAGKGAFTTYALSRHTVTNMALISQFTETIFKVTEGDRGLKEIRVG